MNLLHSAPLLHNHLFIAITLIVLGFLGMLLQRNALATVLSLFLWLQGAGLVFASYGQYQDSREGNLYFLIILFMVMTLLCTLAALVFQMRKSTQHEESDGPLNVSKTQEGTHAGG